MNILRILAMLLATLVPVGATASDGTSPELSLLELWEEDRTQIFNATDLTLDEFKWIARPVVIFADTPADPAFTRQIRLLTERMDELIERDVIIITDTDPDAESALRRKLRPRGFMLTLIGKDGGVKLRKPFPWDVRELTRSIDKMPLRQQEIRDANRGD